LTPTASKTAKFLKFAVKIQPGNPGWLRPVFGDLCRLLRMNQAKELWLVLFDMHLIKAKRFTVGKRYL